MLNDSKLITGYRLDCAGMMFVVYFIRDTLTSPSKHEYYNGRGKSDLNTKIFGNWKNAFTVATDFSLSQLPSAEW